MRKLCLLLALVLLCGCAKTPLDGALISPAEITLPRLEAEPVQTPTETVKPTEEAAPPQVETVAISISCAALSQNIKLLDEEKRELVPSSGWLLPPLETEFREGESVFDLLVRMCREHGILMEFTTSPVYESAYIEGIGNLYEFDAGAQSGWVYSVNGTSPNVGCSSYKLKAGDIVAWEYKIQ